MTSNKYKWNHKNVLESALKYTTAKDWRNAHTGAVNYATNNGIYESCVAHMDHVAKKNIPDEDVLKSALKYTSVAKWKKIEHKFYNMAVKNPKLMARCTAHMVTKETTRWNHDSVYKAALKCKLRTQFKKGKYRGAYNYATKYPELLAKCIKHMSNLHMEKVGVIVDRDIKDIKIAELRELMNKNLPLKLVDGGRSIKAGNYLYRYEMQKFKDLLKNVRTGKTDKTIEVLKMAWENKIVSKV